MNKYLEKLVELEKSAGLDSALAKAKEVGGVLLGKNVQKANATLQKTNKIAAGAGQREWAAGNNYTKEYDGYANKTNKGVFKADSTPLVNAHSRSVTADKRHAQLKGAVNSRRTELANQQALTSKYRRNAALGAAGTAVVGGGGYAAHHYSKKDD
jgi:hypothetical protein